MSDSRGNLGIEIEENIAIKAEIQKKNFLVFRSIGKFKKENMGENTGENIAIKVILKIEKNKKKAKRLISRWPVVFQPNLNRLFAQRIRRFNIDNMLFYFIFSKSLNWFILISLSSLSVFYLEIFNLLLKFENKTCLVSVYLESN